MKSYDFDLKVRNIELDRGARILFYIPNGTYMNDKWISNPDVTFYDVLKQIYKQILEAKKMILQPELEDKF